MFQFIHESLSQYFSQGLHMNPLFIVCIVWFLIQLIKVIVDSIKLRWFATWSIFAAWGFPSFHTWIASSVTMMARLEYWFDSVIFAIACGFALLIAYDAMNVRFESWKQAQCINEIKSEISEVFLLDKKTKKYSKSLTMYDLKERLGHTPIEVLGWMLLWILFTIPLYYYFIIL